MVPDEEKFGSEHDGKVYHNYNYNYNYNQSPLRGVNQRSSIAAVGTKHGEPNQRVGPNAEMQDTQCESWLSIFRTQSNLVSRRDGWRDTEESNARDYSSVRKEITTTMVDHYNHHNTTIGNPRNARADGAN